MELLLIIILIIGFGIIIYLILQKQKPTGDLLEYLRSTNNRLDQQGMSISSQMAQIQRNLGEMGEIGRSMRDFQELLQSPKLRGNVGEQILTQILEQNMPKSSFNLQYAFKNGQKVDVAIKTAGGIIPVDSKFPLDNFRKLNSARSESEKLIAGREFERDVRHHIDDIARKYILTDEGTIDYALMYIPSEAIYYEIVNNTSLFDYSQKMRVLPVSPTTFYAYMRAILMSFEGQKIEVKAKEILSSLRAIQRDYEKTEEDLNVMQRHLNSAFNKMNDVFSSFGKLGGKISATKNLGEERQELNQ